MAKLLPLLIALVGLIGGLGAGIALRPAPDPAEEEAAAAGLPEPGSPAAAPLEPGEFVPMSSHFVIPLVEAGRVRALVILSLSLEVDAGNASAVRSVEPKLRDMFLQVLFDHANAGGFAGAFTAASPMNSLREALRETAAAVIGPPLREILIVDIMRQDS
jgi:flagellar FliL protein